jgi:hypothetical protein
MNRLDARNRSLVINHAAAKSSADPVFFIFGEYLPLNSSSLFTNQADKQRAIKSHKYTASAAFPTTIIASYSTTGNGNELRTARSWSGLAGCSMFSVDQGGSTNVRL